MEDFVKLVKELSIEHPARVIEFSDLTKGLFAEVAKGNINVGYHPEFPHLAIFKYSLGCVMERNWNKFTIMARGLILDLKNKSVIATPFIKFWNYDEIFSAISILEPEFTITEKMDGSLGIMFFYADKFRFATAGSFISEQAQWAEQWMYNKMPLDKIDKTNTYLFEIIYPENKIVVTYDFEGLVLLGIFDTYGLEYNYEQLKWEASYMGTSCTPQHDFADMDSILNNAKTLDSNNEGYVIRFKNGIRLKIKGDEYVRIHRLISRVTPLAIWESIINGDDLTEVKEELPEEMEKDFDAITAILYEKLEIFVKEVEALHSETKLMSDKALGLYIQRNPEGWGDRTFKRSLRYIFPMRKNKFYESLKEKGSLGRKKIFNEFRPTSNRLEGYTPSSAVNRFADMDT